MWMRQRQPLAAEDDDDYGSDDDMMEELGEALGAKYVEPAPAPVTALGKKPNEVKSKFKELMNEKKKQQCNYEKVHALYKTMKKVKPTDEPSTQEKKPLVPRFSRDNFFISRPAVPMVEQFYEKYIKDQAIIDKGIVEGKFV